jgi:hypothetical protein
MNRTQGLVLGFFAVAWVSLVVILIAAPGVYDQSLKLPPDGRQFGEAAFLAGLSVFLGVLSIGVVRRWRWTFWLILVAFLAGVLRVPAAVLELIGVMSSDGPTWYVVFQGFVGLVQVAIGLTMLLGFRRAGIWGEFRGSG